MGILDLLFYAAAWIGHSALWLVALNVLYSQPINKELLKNVRIVVGLIVFGFPLAVWELQPWGNRPLVDGYLIVCAAFCALAIPAFTLLRLLRRRVPHLVAARSEVIDYARELSPKPIGDSKHRRLALLPGNQIFQVEFTELTLTIPGLPAAWDGLTILQLTDLHLTGTPAREFYEAVLDRCMAAGTPDILAVTGDLIDSHSHHRWLLPLLSRLKWNEAGVAILGNHDARYNPQRVRRRLERAGLAVIGNGWRKLSVRGEKLVVLGHEGPWFRPDPDLKGMPADGFRLGLSHTPDNVGWARSNGVRLLLCGHNHGGQIRLPLFGSLFVPSRYSRRYDCGLFWAEPTLMYVGRGLGAREPLRFNCRPEVTRFVLRVG